MPLYIDGCLVCPEDQSLRSLEAFLQKYENVFEERNETLRSQDEQRVPPATSCLYVSQREIAGASPTDKYVTSLGTDMMTTCHAVALHCNRTRASSLAHFDGCFTAGGVREMVRVVEEIASTCEPATENHGRIYQLHIVGGFGDDRNLSEDLSIELLQLFASKFPDSPQFHLQTFCATSLNQKLVKINGARVKSPVVFGLVLSIKSGEMFPAVFDDEAKGPGCALRGAKSLHGPQIMQNIYNWQSGEVVIRPFTYGVFPHIQLWCHQPDHVILRNLSTSPEVEPSNFANHVRQALQFIKDNPHPMHSVFKGNRSLRYQNVDSEWRLMSP